MKQYDRKFVNNTLNEYILITQDEDAENPRNWDNETYMICFHKKYDLPCEVDTIKQENYENWDEMEQDIRDKYDVIELLPIYMYDHSGVTVSTSPFGCRWDSGQIGFIFITKKQYQEYVETNPKEILIEQVKIYDQYLTGDVWGFQLYKITVCQTCNHEHHELIDSCSGFYGYNIDTNGMKEHVSFEGFYEEE